MDRSQLEQQWPAPEREIAPSHPKPWYVAGYTSRALDAVLRMDYGAERRNDIVYETCTGTVRRVSHPEHLYGLRGGTLFVLFDPRGYSPSLDRLIDVAATREIKVEALASGQMERD